MSWGLEPRRVTAGRGSCICRSNHAISEGGRTATRSDQPGSLVESAIDDYCAMIAPTINPPIARSAEAMAPPTSRSNIKGTTRPTAPKIGAVDSKTAVFFKNLTPRSTRPIDTPVMEGRTTLQSWYAATRSPSHRGRVGKVRRRKQGSWKI
jgi:hypothetical protein